MPGDDNGNVDLFMRVAPVETPVPYPIYAFCGLTAWNFFASTLRFALSSLTSNPSLVTKVYFPRLLIPLSSVGPCLLDLAIGCGLMLLLMPFYGVMPGFSLLLAPVMVAGLIIFSGKAGAPFIYFQY